ncbi:MAG: nitrous oxide reductase accessory protein NosL, partial [Hyphomicrobiaceae bacterium]
KAQVYEKGKTKPLWFSSVRDGLAYLLLPGEAQRPVAFYVHDMGRVSNWTKPPDDGVWINARSAVYVLGSSRRGGMGAREAVPFEDPDKAAKFAADFGGHVVAFDKIPTEYLVGDRNDHSPPAAAGKDRHNHQDHQKHQSHQGHKG